MTISYTHVQTVPSLAWTITHNLACAPVCDVIETIGGVVRKTLPDSVRYLDENSILVEFTTATAGQARLIGNYTKPALSASAVVDAGASNENLSGQEVLVIANGFDAGGGPIVGVTGFVGTPVPFQWAANLIAQVQGGVNVVYTWLGNTEPHGANTIEIGSGVDRGGATVPLGAIPVGQTRVRSYVNTTDTDYKYSEFWFAGRLTDQLWVHYTEFNGIGGAFVVGVTIGPNATTGSFYRLTGSATGLTGATQIFSITRVSEPVSAVAVPFAFFDNFAGAAGSLQGRIPSGDTRAWSEFSAGLNLDGSGNMVADSALIATAPTLQVPLAANYTGALALEVVFASIMGTLEDVTSITFDVSGDNSQISILVLADQYNIGDILIQAAGVEHTMTMPAQNVPLTLRVETAAGLSTLFVNGSSVGTFAAVDALGANIVLNVIASGDDIAGGNTMLISSIEVEELAGPLL